MYIVNEYIEYISSCLRQVGAVSILGIFLSTTPGTKARPRGDTTTWGDHSHNVAVEQSYLRCGTLRDTWTAGDLRNAGPCHHLRLAPHGHAESGTQNQEL